MSEVEGFLMGDWNYKHLRGDTGPLVYPAGFVYIFSGFYHLTNSGTNIKLAQIIFGLIYCFELLIIFLIYKKSLFENLTSNYEKGLILLFLIFSKRIHSIFVLRLFNDTIVMLFIYISIYLFLNNRYYIGCFLFSIALSIKMNAMLFLPGLLVVLVLNFGILGFLKYVFVIVITQIALAVPFLLENPMGYLSRSFSTSRTFLMKWSVNMKFVTEEIFHSNNFGKVLLGLHLLILIIFAFKWSLKRGILQSLKGGNQLSGCELVGILFVSNFIGICFMKSMHYQFYVWYFHTIPFLLFQAQIHNIFKIILWIMMEISWNIYPSTLTSSIQLQFVHLVVLLFLLKNKIY